MLNTIEARAHVREVRSLAKDEQYFAAQQTADLLEEACDTILVLQAALETAVNVADGLADQQAMSDPWFEAPLAQAKAVLG